MLPSTLAAKIDEAHAKERAALVKLSHDIHANPELRWEEHKAVAWIAELLESRGFAVDRAFAGMSTALRARAGKTGGPRVAILAEYDALPEIGHACGHNLIAAAGVGAFLAAAAVASEAGGEVVLFGTPAEEGGGGKIKLIEAGAFEGFDAAMMFHPFDRDILAHPALASYWYAFTFRGKPAHAAAAPHAGRSALTACLDTLRLIDGQRVHMRDGVRVHGVVKDGGQAVNIIPERAACEVNVRATSGEELERVRAIVERCARAAAMASDVQIEIEVRQGYREMVNNMAMVRAFGEHARTLGRTPNETDETAGAGSTDMGDVSHVVPSIHPWLGIVDRGQSQIHEHAFARAAISERGDDTCADAARALARTAIELIVDAELLARVRDEHRASTARPR